MKYNITINEGRISGTMKNGIYYPLQIDLSNYSSFQKKAILALTECCEKETINVNKFTRWLEKNVDTLDEENQRAPGGPHTPKGLENSLFLLKGVNYGKIF